jgi:allantoate deiminase
MDLAHRVVDRCQTLAELTEEPGCIKRTFLSAPMRDVHERVSGWMTAAGMSVSVDAAGNIRGLGRGGGRRFYVGSHLDTVPQAGAFDGVLGVVLAIALVESLGERRLPFDIEVIGFSEEEGVRFGAPFIGSRALAGTIDGALLSRCDANGISVRDAIRQFGLDPNGIIDARAVPDALGYLEFHIEQGPVLESANAPLGVVEAIAGQSRLDAVFTGAANHAGTTPMRLRRDALAGAAEWIAAVEREACATAGLVATVGRLDVSPGAGNVIPGICRASLDVRHAVDSVRQGAVARLLGCADVIAARRGLSISSEQRLDQPAVAMDAALTAMLERAVARSGYDVHRLISGAGHDAMILASQMPVAMLFIRSPGGISHHPDESVAPEDVAAALAVGTAFIDDLEAKCA